MYYSGNIYRTAQRHGANRGKTIRDKQKHRASGHNLKTSAGQQAPLRECQGCAGQKQKGTP